MSAAGTVEKSARLLLVAALAAVAADLFWLGRHGLAALAPLQAATQALAAAALLLLIRAGLARRAGEERLEFERDRAREAGRLFDTDADLELLPAVRTHRQVSAWTPPLAALLLGGFLLLRAVQGWQALGLPRAVPLDPLVALAVFGGQAFVFFLLAQYLGALAREPDHRIARGAGNLAGLVFLLAALAAAGALAAHLGGRRVEGLMGRIGWIVCGLAGLELLCNTLAWFYRARGVRARVEPLESRLAGLAGDPGALARDLARTLDYQFGLGFSGSWFFRFCTRGLPLLALAQAALFWLSTTLVWLEPHETGLRERAGRLDRSAVLGPGLHLKWPAPFERIRRFPSGRVQVAQVGYEEETAASADPDLVVWTEPHYAREDIFLTAPPAAASNITASTLGFLNVNLPVSYRITNAVAYATQANDPALWLRHLAYRAVTRELASRGLPELVGDGQNAIAQSLRARVQAEADRIGLGVAIEHVGLHGAHPPLIVAPAYEAAIGAQHGRQTRIQQAKGEASRLAASARGEVEARLGAAVAYKVRRAALEAASAERFTRQLAAHASEPDVYRATLYYRALENALAGVRLFLIPAGVPARVFNLDLTPPPDPSLFEFHDPTAENPKP